MNPRNPVIDRMFANALNGLLKGEREQFDQTVKVMEEAHKNADKKESRMVADYVKPTGSWKSRKKALKRLRAKEMKRLRS